MPCNGLSPDYTCQGWVARRNAIRARDGNRCRGCNRGEDEIRLEVHHRTYGKPGPCGQCVLTGIIDDDLVTLCLDCHDAITSIRRRVRYGLKEIEAVVMDAPQIHQSATVMRTIIDADIVEPVASGVGYVPPRVTLW